MLNTDAIQLSDAYLMRTYGRLPVAFERGEGCYLWDVEGNRYLDMLAGLAVCGLGHCHPRVVEALRAQAGRLMHTSNLYHIPLQARLAELLASQMEEPFRAFFCNSGAEANEASLKLARKWARVGGRGSGVRGQGSGPEQATIITTLGSFHGRTLMTVTATGQEKYQKWFTPLVPGFRYVPYGDADAAAAAVDETTIAIMVEPIQGESGVIIPPEGYLTALRQICDRHGILLILDEIQTGLGRTGKFFAYQHEGIVPDIVTLAKSLAGGFPIGACLARDAVASAFEPGDHASTFGGNPLACAAGLAAVRTILDEGLLDNAARMGQRIIEKLQHLAKGLPHVREVRGRGLMVAVEFSDASARDVNQRLFERRILANAVGDSILRVLPPLVVGDEQIEEFMEGLAAAL